MQVACHTYHSTIFSRHFVRKWRESVAAAPIIPLSFVNLLSAPCFRLYAGDMKVSRYEKALEDGNETPMKGHKENTLDKPCSSAMASNCLSLSKFADMPQASFKSS